MSQLALFNSRDERVLADDERGRIIYRPAFVDPATADAWFAGLRHAVTWRNERHQMYDREVDVPRLTGHYRLDPAPARTPAVLLDAAARVTAELAVPFNAVGLNLYRDGRDSVAPHNDHLCELRKGFPIALRLAGRNAPDVARAKEAPRRAIHIDLEHGRLFVMDYATQIHYTHGVPKTSETAERISLAFRVKPERSPGRAKYA